MPELTPSREALALVPIRSGSKGLPGKNVRPLAGTPLYAYAVSQGLRIAGRCVVTTDISSVLRSPAPDGCLLIRRSDDLCRDNTSMDDVIKDVITQLDLSSETTILLLQATSPLRSDADVIAARELHGTGRFDLVMSVTATDSSVLKYGTLSNQEYCPVSRPEYCFTNRQSLPAVFRPNGAVYVFTVGSFLRNDGLASKSIGAVEMPKSRSTDIDTLADFEAVEAQLSADAKFR